MLCAGIQEVFADNVLINDASGNGTFEYDKAIVKDIRHVIDIAWVPDGRVLVAAKEGELYIFDDLEDNNTRELIHNVNPCTEQERALLSITVHPKFGTETDGRYDYIYVYWVHKGKNGNCYIPSNFNNIDSNGPYCQLSRFKLTKSNRLQNEHVLLKTGNAGKINEIEIVMI